MLNKSLKSLISDINDEVAILANASALIYELLPNVNWVGFYLHKNNKLILGPFQGRPACVEIEIGKGACGMCAENLTPIIIEDVSKVSNYISCHAETQSEIVLPIVIKNKLYGVLDIDSKQINRFSFNEQKLLQKSTQLIANKLLSLS